MEPSETKENENFINSQATDGQETNKRKQSPLSALSASESEDEGGRKRTKTSEDVIVESREALSLPTIKIQPILGGKALLFPVHPRLTLIDLKDFILFALNIPHPQQILSFYDEDSFKMVLLSNFSENTLLCSVPGLIDEVTGRCAPVSLSFKMSSGMDFSIHPSDIEYESNKSNENEDDMEGFFEISSDEKDKKLSMLATSLVSIIPLPPGVNKTSKMLFRSLSKSSPTNSNLPTLWEIYFPESGIKMMVTALINVSEVKGESEEVVDKKETEVAEKDLETTSENQNPSIAPKLVITSEEEEILKALADSDKMIIPTIPAAPLKSTSNEPKNHCEKCKIRCRPALRFICKCSKTFCQSHRYPDKHECTFDHRAEGLAAIQANNPKIVKDKVSNF